MKRLLWYLNQIADGGTSTFRYTVMSDGNPVQKEIYDGECEVVYLKPGGDVINPERMGVRREPTYWQNGVSYTFDRTNRAALSCPTVTAAVPVKKLNFNSLTPAAADFCLRQAKPCFDSFNAEYENKARPDYESGRFYVYEPEGEVLVRNASYFALRPGKDFTEDRRNIIFVKEYTDPAPDEMCLCVRIEIQLPHGKLKRAKKMLTSDLPSAVERFVNEFDMNGFNEALALEAKQNGIRKFLRQNGYAAFIANGSIIAREKCTRLPMKDSLPFTSTPEDEIVISVPGLRKSERGLGLESPAFKSHPANTFEVRGMGIKKGVTVITGGGYSGKSTVLNAISSGIYNHCAGDGRELCITDDTAVTVTAEDGRAVSCLNIAPFIKWLPSGDAHTFSTSHASGSTSQAANIMEAVESGAGLLLIDEDRSATNFMIRDALMKTLIEKEPVTPFTARVRELAADGVSTVLVIGGSGEYLSVADKVYMMDNFKISDVTEKAKGICVPQSDIPVPAVWETNRVMLSGGFSSYPVGSGTERLEVSDMGFIIMGDERVDIRSLHDIATPAQVDALAFMLRYLANKTADGGKLERLALSLRGIGGGCGSEIDIKVMIRELYEKIDKEGLDAAGTGFFTSMNRFMDLPREFELRAAVNRLRNIRFVTRTKRYTASRHKQFNL